MPEAKKAKWKLLAKVARVRLSGYTLFMTSQVANRPEWLETIVTRTGIDPRK